MSDLSRFRADIDDIDDRIVDLLARRFAISREVADHKLRHGIPIVLPERIEQVKTRCADRAGRQGIDRTFMLALYALIIEETCEPERALQRTGPPVP